MTVDTPVVEVDLASYLERAAPDRRADLDWRRQYDSEDGIVAFVVDVLGVEHIAPYQLDILRAFYRQRFAAVRGPHGLGKTALAAWIVLWAIVVFPDDAKIVTTASAWRQLTKFLWPEIRKWAARVNWSAYGVTMRLGREILDLSIKLPGKEAFAVASNNPALIEGAHARYIVYIFDEAKAIPVGIWDAAEGAFSTAGVDTDHRAYALAISTPGDTSGRFYEIHTKRRGFEKWWTRHVTLDEAIAAGRISRSWADDMREAWGEKSAVYRQRVLGEFDDSGEDAVIPLSWVERAHERWYARQGKGSGPLTLGVDPAWKGDDKTTVARMVGTVVEDVKAYAKLSTMHTAGLVVKAMRPGALAAIDTIGIGAGVYDRLRELGKNVVSVNVSERTTVKDRTGEVGFVNLRSALWWMLRDALDPDSDEPIALPPDEALDLPKGYSLVGDLTTPRYEYTSSGQIKVESKDEIRKRINRSTDYGDAVILALYAQRAPKKAKKRRLPKGLNDRR